MKRLFTILVFGSCLVNVDATDTRGAEHRVSPGDDPQAVLDRAAPGDRVILLPGMHQRPLGRHQSILYVDKPIDLELAEGATLKLADGQTSLLSDPEITTDHSRKTIDDLEMGGTYDLKRGSILLTLTIDSSGSGNKPDTFKWAFGVFGKPQPGQSTIAITGQWQSLASGIKVRFGQRGGHNKGAFWFISYDGRESYGIRIGHGTQKKYIENVRISGRGTIDLNRQNNVQPSPMVKDISACVLVHGRVRNVHIEGITMTNTMRSVMLYGQHTGKLLPGGKVGKGESFDAENITIVSTQTINPGGAAYLLGHPSHRGRLTNVHCNFNTMRSATTSLEPNFNLDRYEVIGNLIQSDGLAIHCWRRSTTGRIAHNVRVGDARRRPVVVNSAPGGWKRSEKLTFSENVNLQKGPLPESFSAPADRPSGHLMLRAVTDDDVFNSLGTNKQQPLVLPAGSRSVYRLVVLARSQDGSEYAAFSASGKVQNGPEGVKLSDNSLVPASLSNNAIRMRVRALDNAIGVEVRGLPGKKLTWVGRMELSPAAGHSEPTNTAGPRREGR